MQISRKCKHYSDWCAAGVFADTWKSWGFIDGYTEGEIEPNVAYHGQYSNYNYSDIIPNETEWKYKWKYDTNDSFNYFYFGNRQRINSSTRYTKLFFNTTYSKNFSGIMNYDNSYSLSSYQPLLLNQYMYRADGISYNWCIYGSDYYNMFFMPLKNNGFFYNREASSPVDNQGNFRSSATIGFPIKLMTYYKQLSPYLWDLYSYRRTVHSDTNAYFKNSNCSVIGFFNNITNKMNYIILVIPEGQGETLKTIYTYWDHKDGAISTSIPYMDSTGEYTDVKENICTLIKYPYDDGALSNLFLISTCPQRKKRSFMNEIANDACGLEGKFFSFNGRNFYGFYNNLAVELPSN